MALEAVSRIRPTRQQIGLTRAGRKRNLRGAFAVPDSQKHRLKGRAVVIVDDVLTTGATVEAMARIFDVAAGGVDFVMTATNPDVAFAAEGPLRFDRFVDAALYGVEGFYTRPAAGRAGRRGASPAGCAQHGR